jgi:hypothetical protein
MLLVEYLHDSEGQNFPGILKIQSENSATSLGIGRVRSKFTKILWLVEPLLSNDRKTKYYNNHAKVMVQQSRIFSRRRENTAKMEKAFHVHFFSTCVLPEPASSCSQLEH